MLIDLHVHILPGLDDGAQTMDQAMAMADMAAQDGITILVATPHVVRGVFDTCKQDILNKVEQLNQCLSENGTNLLVLPGAEYRLEPDLPQRLADNELITVNNTDRYLMIELPAALIPENTERILYEIQLQGVTPIIAHPERNLVLARYPELLQAYVDRGMLAQVTSASITGLFGRIIKKTALNFLYSGAVQIIASDGHSTNRRVPVLSPAFKAVERIWGNDYANNLICENPRRIISGQNLLAFDPPQRQNWFNRGPWQEIGRYCRMLTKSPQWKEKQ